MNLKLTMMDKNEVIEKLLTPEERKQLILILPDQWVKRNRHLIDSSMKDRYAIDKEGTIVDIYNHLWIAFRQMHWRLQQLIELSEKHPNNDDLGEKLRSLLCEMKIELNL
jgi:hypothetical protein